MIFDIIKKTLSKTHTADTISISYNENNVHEASSTKAEESTVRASLDYENVSISDYDVLVLWWISKKKKG